MSGARSSPVSRRCRPVRVPARVPARGHCRSGLGPLEFDAGLVEPAELDQQVAADAGQQVVAAAAPGRRRGWSTSARPACRTVGHAERDRAVQLDDRRSAQPRPAASYSAAIRASRSPPRCGPGVARRDRRLQDVRARACRRARSARSSAASPRRSAAGPTAPVLVEQQHRLSVRAGPGVRAATPGSPSTRPGRAPRARRGDEPAQDAAEPERSSHKCGPHPVVAGGGGVALVEDQVDAPRGPTAAGRRASAARHLERHLGLGERLLGPDDPLRDGRLGTRNALAISSVVSPPSSRSVSATRASRDSTGWQAMNISRSRSSPRSSSSAASESPVTTSSVASSSRLISSYLRRAASRCAGTGRWRGAWRPSSARRRVVGHARLGPLLERRLQRVLRELFGEADVAAIRVNRATSRGYSARKTASIARVGVRFWARGSILAVTPASIPAGTTATAPLVPAGGRHRVKPRYSFAASFAASAAGRSRPGSRRHRRSGGWWSPRRRRWSGTASCSRRLPRGCRTR